ncbi:hypothetical protein WA158_005784 [Blastocystis sp. Blastoise]
MEAPSGKDFEQVAESIKIIIPDFEERINAIRQKNGFIIDMDGVIYHGDTLLPYITEFIEWLETNNKKYLFLTNNSAPTPKELQSKLQRLGLNIGIEHFYTSAIATARFLYHQTNGKGGKVYCVGEPGIQIALYEKGFIIDEIKPDYVVIGEGRTINFDTITHASRLVANGAKLIYTNPDANCLVNGGIKPGCGAFNACIEMASGKKGFYVGKPSSLMMKYAQQILDVPEKETCIIGDNMKTDVLAGVLAEIDPVLVLTGVTALNTLDDYAYSPFLILPGAGYLTLNIKTENNTMSSI